MNVQEVVAQDRLNPKPKLSHRILYGMNKYKPISQEEALQRHLEDSIVKLQAEARRRKRQQLKQRRNQQP